MNEAAKNIEDIHISKIELPPIEDCSKIIDESLDSPTEIICGLLHQGSKMALGGGSKSFKSWALIDLAASVATGSPWWGMETEQCKVLYINFEIRKFFFRRRLITVLQDKEITISNRQLDHWCLRGKMLDPAILLNEFEMTLRGAGYGLIIADPTYKLMVGRDENSAGDVATILNGFERIAESADAAICFGTHFSKGNQAEKDHMDRISGSGVYARDPDTILTMTKHESELSYTIDATLRDFPPIDPFVVRFEFPLFKRADDLDPEHLKTTKYQNKYDRDDVLALLDEGGMTAAHWQKVAGEELGIGKSRFYDFLKHFKREGLIHRETVSKKWVRIKKAQPNA